MLKGSTLLHCCAIKLGAGALLTLKAVHSLGKFKDTNVGLLPEPLLTPVHPLSLEECLHGLKKFQTIPWLITQSKVCDEWSLLKYWSTLSKLFSWEHYLSPQIFLRYFRLGAKIDFWTKAKSWNPSKVPDVGRNWEESGRTPRLKTFGTSMQYQWEPEGFRKVRNKFTWKENTNILIIPKNLSLSVYSLPIVLEHWLHQRDGEI